MNWTEIKQAIRKHLQSIGLANPNIRLNALNSIEKLLDKEYIQNPNLFLLIDKDDLKESLSKKKKLNSAEKSIINHIYDTINGNMIATRLAASFTPKKEEEIIIRKDLKESFAPIVDNETVILVLGTMPGEESLKQNQYYANKNNQFWKIIQSVLAKDSHLESYEQKMNLLKKNKIGLWDVLQVCNREGSSDSSIKNHVVNDFTTFFKDYPNIKKLLFNGKDSYKYFVDKFGQISGINYSLMPSTSSAYPKSLEEKRKMWENGLKLK